MEKLIQAYLFEGRCILCPMARTERKLIVATGPCLELSGIATIAELGQNILATLDRFRNGIPHFEPSTIPESETPILKHVGMKNFRTLMKSAKAVSIQSLDDKVSFVPTVNDKRYGYVPHRELQIQIDASSIEQLYPSLKLAFDLCR